MAATPRNVLVLYSNGRLLPANIEGDGGLAGLAGPTWSGPERPGKLQLMAWPRSAARRV